MRVSVARLSYALVHVCALAAPNFRSREDGRKASLLRAACTSLTTTREIPPSKTRAWTPSSSMWSGDPCFFCILVESLRMLCIIPPHLCSTILLHS